jgi:hypothetical protein
MLAAIENSQALEIQEMPEARRGRVIEYCLQPIISLPYTLQGSLSTFASLLLFPSIFCRYSSWAAYPPPVFPDD